MWRELDNYVGTVVENDRERVVERANDLADRMLRAQVGLAETLYKREWNENTAPMMSVLLPGTRSGGTTACRFDHPDQRSNGLMLRLPDPGGGGIFENEFFYEKNMKYLRFGFMISKSWFKSFMKNLWFWAGGFSPKNMKKYGYFGWPRHGDSYMF